MTRGIAARALGLGIALATGLWAARATASEQVPPPRFADPERRAKLERAFPELERIASRWASEQGLPGLAWGVVIDGELARFGSVGHRDVERALPIDADTVFRIASMTKSFTALAILMLRDEGKLALDAPVSSYVPELATLAPPTRDAPAITVRHLLTHAAGFPEDNPWGDRQMAIGEETLSRWLAAGLPFSTATGSSFEYSNYGYAILGRIVSNVSGMPYRRYVDERILAPLGMRASRWDAREVPKGMLATGYRRQDGRFLAEAPLADGAFNAMGGLFTSSRDLARWVGWMLAAWPPRDDPERPPARRSSVREMQQGAGFPGIAVRRASPGAPLEGTASVYAFGLSSTDTCDPGWRIGHSGGFPGFGSQMVWLPEHGVGLFGMVNLTYAAPSRMLLEMIGALRRTGGLEPRRPAPSPALLETTQRLGQLVNAWSDASARELAADNLFLDESLERRRAAIAALREGLGACTAAPIEAENALRGRFRMRCERGWLDVDFTLAPTLPPRVQHLAVSGGRTPSDAMLRAASNVLEAMSQGPRALDLARAADRDAFGALLASVRESHGACRLGEPRAGDGERSLHIGLDCERGPLDLSLARSNGGIESLRLAPAPGTACIP